MRVSKHKTPNKSENMNKEHERVTSRLQMNEVQSPGEALLAQTGKGGQSVCPVAGHTSSVAQPDESPAVPQHT